VAVIRVDDLRKRYGEIEAVAGVSFDVSEGEVYGLLGHNGAGKSTTVEILEGHRKRTSGDVSVLGMDPASGGRQFRDRIGVVLQSSGVETELSVKEAILLYGSVYRRRRPLDELLDLVGLDEKADARIGTLSGGQRRRLDLALGIVGCPDLVFLDEPTTGFDPAARRKSWDLIQGLCSLGTTVLLTTHYLDEAEHLADRVGVLSNGKLVAEGSPAELIGGAAQTVISFSIDGGDPSDLIGLIPEGTLIDTSRVEISTSSPTQIVHDVTGWALERGVELSNLSVVRPSLEDVFLELAERDTP
jgi:ABC-2 type transport system ATP-binding protein